MLSNEMKEIEKHVNEVDELLTLIQVLVPNDKVVCNSVKESLENLNHIRKITGKIG